jgi:phage terminase small subunit
VGGPGSPPALKALRERDRKFVEGICAGMSSTEAARYAGSKAKTSVGLASHASRWRARPGIEAAIRELRAQHAIECEALWDSTMKALRDLIADRGNPNARIKAAELLARLTGRIGTERHEHLHAHMEARDAAAPEDRAELVRLMRITLSSLPPGERAGLVAEVLREPEGEPAPEAPAP